MTALDRDAREAMSQGLIKNDETGSKPMTVQEAGTSPHGQHARKLGKIYLGPEPSKHGPNDTQIDIDSRGYITKMGFRPVEDKVKGNGVN